MRLRILASVLVLPLVVDLTASSARADDDPDGADGGGVVTPPATPSTPSTPTTPTSPPTSASDTVAPPTDPARSKTVEPKPSEPAPPTRNTFDVDPIVDGTIVAVSLGFAGTTDLINSTGEIRPQQISATFDKSQLLGIDRGAVSQTISKHAGLYSNIGLVAAIAYAVVDPFVSGLREQDVQTGIADGFMYAESLSVTLAFTNLTKISVRRPRPVAYMDAAAHKGDPNYSNTDTDSTLSFFSGHASNVAAVGGTATYLAFARSPRSIRPWITMAAFLGLGTFVSYERVRSGAHFPTDVIAGSIAGAGIGVIVPHLHRTTDIKQRRMWVGYAPVQRGEGGGLQLSGIF